MTLLLLKTKNLTWQDHTINIEVMISPQGSTLLMNKHKALDAKMKAEMSMYDRQRESRIKDFLIEKQFIQRHRTKLIKRSLELAIERRSKSETLSSSDSGSDLGQTRSSSAPVSSRRSAQVEGSCSSTTRITQIPFPRVPLRGSALFAATLRKSNVYSESDESIDNLLALPKPSLVNESNLSLDHGVYLTEMQIKPREPSSPILTFNPMPPQQKDLVHGSQQATAIKQTDTKRTVPSVRFAEGSDANEDSGIEFIIKDKTLKDKVSTFLKEQKDFNVRPPSVARSADITKTKRAAPLVAHRYRVLTLDTQVLEKSFDTYCENKSYDNLMKTMNLAAKMKSHVRQARNTSLVPSIAVFKSTRTFLQLLKRQKQKQAHEPQALEMKN